MDMPAGIGETLREARLAAGVDVDDVEKRIRIRAKYLLALEAEDFEALPGDAYVRGFLHSYADFLGLDGAALVASYERLARAREPEQPVEVALEAPRGSRGSPFRASAGMFVGVVAVGLVALFVVLGLTGGSSDDGGGGGQHHGGGKRPHSTTTKSTTTPASASVRLTATGTVWVCLVDQSGKLLVNGETLNAGEKRGPFEARELKLNLGNGGIQIDLNGDAVSIPDAANPIGFDLTPNGARPLPATARPTCT
jgi:cytoskeleton protein RodZ